MAAKWGVKRRTVDKLSGEVVYILNDGRKVLEQLGRNVFERPEMVRGRVKQKERERHSRFQ